MNARKSFILVTMLLAVTIVVMGCYTIINHPSVQETRTSVDSEQYTHTAQDRDCMRCHQDFSEYPYGYYYSDYYPEYYWTHPDWGSYYAYPWWWDHYWYKEGDAAGNQAGDRPDRRRQGLAPPYTRGAEPYIPPPPPTFSPGGSSGGTGTTTGGSTGGSGGGTTTNQDEKEEQKPPKRRGGKGGGDN